MNHNKFLILSLSLGLTLGGGAAATIALHSQSPTALYGEEVKPSHSITVTSIAYCPVVTSSSENYSDHFLVASLDNAGGYFYMENTFDKVAVNTDGHLMALEAGSALNTLSINIDAVSSAYLLYATVEDYEKEKPLDVFGFADLRRIEIQMGEGNEVTLDKYNGTEREKSISHSYDSKTQTHVYEGPFSDGFTEYYFLMPDLALGKKLVIDKIILSYNC